MFSSLRRLQTDSGSYHVGTARLRHPDVFFNTVLFFDKIFPYISETCRRRFLLSSARRQTTATTPIETSTVNEAFKSDQFKTKLK